MLSDSDPAVPSNGDLAPRSNGAAAAKSSSVAPNGTRKSTAVNGSSNGTKALAANQSTYFGHDREEVTRILIQALSDMGYKGSAEVLSKDSGYKLENATVAAFRSAILNGEWADAENMLLGAAESEAHGGEGNGLVLAEGSDRDLMRFWVRQQKYLELLEQSAAGQALPVLRRELTPLSNDPTKLHFLSSLLMCPDPADLRSKARWDGAQGSSRKDLLSDLSKCISPSVMLPENRLAVLLQSVKQSQIDTCLYHTTATSPSLLCDHSCSRDNFPSELALTLDDLEGEVWQVQFSPDGTRLAGCGNSNSVVIWDEDFKVCQRLNGHETGVGNVAWSPDSKMLVTCSQDHTARVWNVATGETLRKTRKFGEPVTSCVWASDGESFTLGTLDNKRGICSYNVDTWEEIDWAPKHRVQELCGSKDGRWILAVNNQTTMFLYNGLTRELEYEMDFSARPTSISISEDSHHLLVNKQDGEAQLIHLETRLSVQKFLGQTSGDCMIRCSFGGANESFVVSGSEDGNILVWHKTIGAAVERLQGHKPRCNAVVWSPWRPDRPSLLASCGDDGTVKIWAPPAWARARQAGVN